MGKIIYYREETTQGVAFLKSEIRCSISSKKVLCITKKKNRPTLGLSKEIGKLRYWGNSWDECVVREDEQGNRYIKRIGQDRESLAPVGSMTAYGGIGYGEYHLLETISEERYLTFGKSWYYGKNGEIIDSSSK